MSQNYDNGDVLMYQFPAAAVDTAAVIGRILGPAGKQGRLMGIASAVTADVTVAAAGIRVGSTSDPDAYGTHSIPVSSADAVVTTYTDLTSDSNLIPADSLVEIDSDGAATAGDADLFVTIKWF